MIPTVMGEKEIEIDAGIGQQNQNEQVKKKSQHTFGNEAYAKRADMD